MSASDAPWYRAFGYRFQVDGSAAQFLERALVGMRSSVADRVPGDHGHLIAVDMTDDRVEPSREPTLVLTIDDTESFRTTDRGALLHQAVWEITQRAVAGRAASVVLHAAAVAIDERPVIVTGMSGAGKSTLAAALVAAGGNYLTDEAVELGPDGLPVDAIARPVHLSRTSIEMLGSPLLGDADVPMPGGGRYMVVSAGKVDDCSGLPVVIHLTSQEGGLRTERPARSDVVASLVRNSFASASTSQTGLEIVKNLSTSASSLTICGGSTADRAACVKNFLLDA